MCSSFVFVCVLVVSCCLLVRFFVFVFVRVCQHEGDSISFSVDVDIHTVSLVSAYIIIQLSYLLQQFFVFIVALFLLISHHPCRPVPSLAPYRSGVLGTQKLKFPLLRTQS